MLNARSLGMVILALTTAAACSNKTSLSQPLGCKGSTAQADRRCNDDLSLPAVAGVCQSDGTCSCNSGFVLSSTTKRCKQETAGDASASVCTVGSDQTCNDDVNLSATAGVCQAGGVCSCKTSFVLNLTTGRCKTGQTGSSADAAGDSAVVSTVCTFLVDQTCNDDNSFSGTAGTCTKSATCTCNAGFVINPATGRCKTTVTPDADGTGKDAGLVAPDAQAPGKDAGPEVADAQVPGKDTGGVCTPGADQTCNDNAAPSYVSGICQSNGTCLCRSGYVINPSSGRCSVPDASAKACTYPVNETCNDDSAAPNTIRGTCQSDGTCLCNTGYLLNPSTGRCISGKTDAGTVLSQVCTPGNDQTCNDNPRLTTLQGICQANGLCVCASGYEINLVTGLCMATTAGACTGAYDACGCGCCGGTSPSLTCYYPGAGDSLNAIVAADTAAGSSPSCATAGCSSGKRYVCCADAPPDTGGNAQYSAKYLAGGLDHISLNRNASDGSCATFSLVNPSSTTSTTFRITTPTKWSLETSSISGGACGDGGAGLRAVGGLGSVTLSPSGTSCAMNVHVTLYFAVNSEGGLYTIRIDADNIAISGGPSSSSCQ